MSSLSLCRARAAAGGPAPRACTLAGLFRAHRGRLLVTYALFNLENLVNLARPWALGAAVNSLPDGSCGGLLLLAAVQVAFLTLCSCRQMYDVRAFTRIYTELASRLVLRQRAETEVSRLAARSALCRELVDFFERDVPAVLQSLYAVVGALALLALGDGLLVPVCLLLLLPVCWLSRTLGRTTHGLNRQLNDQLEREVEVIGRGEPRQVRSHYERVSHWRVRLTDRQACTFGTMQLFVLGLLLIALIRCGTRHADVGRIFAVVGYVQMFAMSLADVPHLVQQWSRLRDISRRVQEAGS